MLTEVSQCEPLNSFTNRLSTANPHF